ncbi:hypothetical protein L596_009665 [Steinernema carpocapsae]|uniref:Uncharacterized protein n=1 Tax=Steinernema carpocapsae TaxID=34508 RepID=A0A4U5PGT5_STECR|nr:hypothetical protein L596_009665 [Steinernema carpocapsae]
MDRCLHSVGPQLWFVLEQFFNSRSVKMYATVSHRDTNLFFHTFLLKDLSDVFPEGVGQVEEFSEFLQTTWATESTKAKRRSSMVNVDRNTGLHGQRIS